MNDQDYYDKARDYIIEHGWTQARPEDQAGKVCIMGALFRAVIGQGWGCQLSDVPRVLLDKFDGLAAALNRRAWDLGFRHTVYFNDAKNTTQADALTFLSEKWEALKDDTADHR